MTRDERATMVFITFPHVSPHREKEASSVLIRPLGKTRRTLYQEWRESEARRGSILCQQSMNRTNLVVDTSAVDIDDFDGPKAIVCIDLEMSLCFAAVY